MKRPVYFLEVFVGDMGVDLSGCDIRVPKQCLHRPEICTILEKIGRK
jgi:hypothetical protein